jgi:hypothetical protein
MDNLKADLDEIGRFLEYLKRAEEYGQEIRKKLLAAHRSHTLLGYWSCQLPTELMSKIFLMLEEDCNLKQRSYWATRTLPLVCKRWKDISEATLSLWNGRIFMSEELSSGICLESAERNMFFNPMVECPLSVNCVELSLPGYIYYYRKGSLNEVT